MADGYHCEYCIKHDSDIGKVYDNIFEGKIEEACRKLGTMTEISSHRVYFAIISEPLLSDIKFGLSVKELPYYIEFSKRMLSYNIEPYGPYSDKQKKALEKLQAFVAEH